jgi:hypothetical protein
MVLVELDDRCQELSGVNGILGRTRPVGCVAGVACVLLPGTVAARSDLRFVPAINFRYKLVERS